jgi:hypothetical protein
VTNAKQTDAQWQAGKREEAQASVRAALTAALAVPRLDERADVRALLWKIGDAATMQLMLDFYRRLWLQKQDPHAVLWQAKAAARQRGAPFRDWAGWVRPSGEPR